MTDSTDENLNNHSSEHQEPSDDFDTDEMGTSDGALNHAGWDLVSQIMTLVDDLRVEPVEVEGGGLVLDFGVETTGSLGAGLALAEVCLAGLGEVSIQTGDVGGIGWPHLFVSTDNPVEACLLSQYAGWRISVGKYFAMGSGPMRSAAAREEMFQILEYQEDVTEVVGVLEASRLPTTEVIREIATRCHCEPDQVALLVAPTASVAGNMQVVARSVETAMHKLFELGFDVTRVESGCGWTPISPVAQDDLTGIGRTNDAILYGTRVHLWVHGDDESIVEIGPKVPASASSAYGQPFLKIFEAAGHDFYKIDPLLFSPAEIIFQNVETGRVHHFGGLRADIVKQSFGL